MRIVRIYIRGMYGKRIETGESHIFEGAFAAGGWQTEFMNFEQTIGQEDMLGGKALIGESESPNFCTAFQMDPDVEIITKIFYAFDTPLRENLLGTLKKLNEKEEPEEYIFALGEVYINQSN